MRRQLRFVGVGGQGVILAGEIFDIKSVFFMIIDFVHTLKVFKNLQGMEVYIFVF